jgi:hypothetical protein
VYIWAKYSLEESQDPEKRKLFKEKFYEYLGSAEKVHKTNLDATGREKW